MSHGHRCSWPRILWVYPSPPPWATVGGRKVEGGGERGVFSCEALRVWGCVCVWCIYFEERCTFLFEFLDGQVRASVANDLCVLGKQSSLGNPPVEREGGEGGGGGGGGGEADDGVREGCALLPECGINLLLCQISLHVVYIHTWRHDKVCDSVRCTDPIRRYISIYTRHTTPLLLKKAMEPCKLSAIYICTIPPQLLIFDAFSPSLQACVNPKSGRVCVSRDPVPPMSKGCRHPRSDCSELYNSRTRP